MNVTSWVELRNEVFSLKTLLYDMLGISAYYALSLAISKQCLKSIDVDFINAQKVSSRCRCRCSCSQIAFMAFHFYLILHMQFTSYQRRLPAAPAPPRHPLAFALALALAINTRTQRKFLSNIFLHNSTICTNEATFSLKKMRFVRFWMQATY